MTLARPAWAIRRSLALPVLVAAAALILQPASGTLAGTSLSTAPPAWYTPAFHRAVMAAGSEGMLLPSAAALPSSSIIFAGIRPGAWMVYPSWCTMNFIFSPSGVPGDGGPYYIGTAKHCVGRVGDPVVVTVSLTPGSPPKAITVGTVSHVTDSGEQVIGSDFALVKIDAALHASISPSMAHVGGPTATYRGTDVVPILQTGHGAVLGSGGMARAGATASYNTRFPHGYGMALPAMIGDSGSPVRTSGGEALGNVTHIGVDLSGAFVPGNAFGTRVSRVEQDWGLKVVTCKFTTPWLGPGCPPFSV